MRNVLQLVVYPDPILEKICKNVDTFDENLILLAFNMLDLMRHSNGIGLAAPQVGVDLRLFVMNVGGKQRIVVNPKIKTETGNTSIEEGCLSFPGIQVRVERFSVLSVEYQDDVGKTVTETLSGLEAICFQHELDHLNGKTFIDILSPTTKSFIAKKLERKKREQAT